jgi:hypothetical protein
MRFDLKVPFADKDAAKKLGARWDAARKLWYIADKTDVTPFAKWSPTPHDAAGSVPAAQTSAPVRTQTSGKIHVGSAYVEPAKVCACPPWEVCGVCRPTSFAG